MRAARHCSGAQERQVRRSREVRAPGAPQAKEMVSRGKSARNMQVKVPLENEARTTVDKLGASTYPTSSHNILF